MEVKYLKKRSFSLIGTKAPCGLMTVLHQGTKVHVVVYCMAPFYMSGRKFVIIK